VKSHCHSEFKLIQPQEKAIFLEQESIQTNLKEGRALTRIVKNELFS